MTATFVNDTSSYLNSGADNTQASSQSSGTAATTSAQVTPKTTSNTQTQQDQVKISLAAQAQSLKSQGESVKQIAEALGVTTKVVDTYLGITSTSSGSSGAAGHYSASQVSQLLGTL